MKKSILYTLIIGAFVFSSCGDELELTPTSLIGVTSFWNTEDDVKGGVTGMYVRFRTQAYDNLFFWGGSRSEILGYGLQASEGLERYFENSLDANTAAGPSWQTLYTVIHDANLIIKNVPEITFTNPNEQNRALAQAHAMRAYVYFTMARVWGGVPIVTDPSEGFNPDIIFKSRNSVDEIVSLVKSDIDQAISLFPDNNFTSGRAVWTKPATNAMKGEVYLWTAKRMGGGTGDMQTALDALNAASNSDVSLLDNFDDVFRYNNKGNNEILMAVHLEDLESGNMFNDLMYLRNDQIPANADAASVALVGTGGGLLRWAPAEGFRNQFTTDDSRRNATFAEMFTIDETTGDSTLYASPMLKYRGFVDAGARKFMDDVILYRQADVLLMIAEAKNGMGQDPSAEINMVRERAYGANFSGHEYVNSSQDANDEAILKERLLELAFEGKRWYDLVRFEKAFELVPSLMGRESEQHLLLWPIGASTISLNSSIEQNPGY